MTNPVNPLEQAGRQAIRKAWFSEWCRDRREIRQLVDACEEEPTTENFKKAQIRIAGNTQKWRVPEE